MTFWIVGALIVLLGVFVWRAKAHAGRLNDYFRGAVEMYGLIGDPEARLAAMAAAKVAAGAQRASMMHYLRGMASDVARVPAPPGVEPTAIRDRLLSLEREIGSTDWSVADVLAAKRELGSRAPRYLAALENADSSVFTRT